jgi:GntP family gluconate:H+ symporter
MTTAVLQLAAQTTKPWTAHDTRLIVVAILAIAVIVVLISAAKMHPFLALVIGSAVIGIGGGVGVADVITNFETGVGDTLKEVGLLIALGAMLGKLLSDSGGADRVVDTLVNRSGPRLLPWAVALVAMIIGLPMFFEIGLVLLLPVIILVTRKSGLPLMRIAIPALAGLSALHGLIPPHPGPLIAIAAVNAQLGVTLGLGIIVAIPTVIISGPLFSYLAARWVPVGAPSGVGGVDLDSRGGSGPAAAADVTDERAGSADPTEQRQRSDPPVERAASAEVRRPPSFAVTLATILCPVVLMLLKALADVIWDNEKTRPLGGRFLDFIGEPLVALFLAVLLAMFTFGFAVGFSRQSITDRIGASLGPIAGIILIVGAGGGFKNSLIGAGAGDTVAKIVNHSGIPIIVIGYLLAVAIRLATGSATVATTTAAGIVAPLVGHLPGTHLALLALAVGAGSLFLSHVNDAGFWLVNQMFRLSVGQTFKTWSVMETLLSIVAFLVIDLLWALT